MRLPGSLDELRGLRAARWIRESTAGQADNFGPDAQRDAQDLAIIRHGLRDTGVTYDVSHSGRTIATTPEWAAMIAAAGHEYDVLVVGYVSRFARDLRTAVNARHDLHAAGAAILFAADRLLTSDDEAWEHWAREAVEAEAYSRRLGKRIREGYAAKRRRLGIPGGNRAPLGTVRRGRELAVDEHGIGMIRTAFDIAAAGLTDREVAATLGLRLKHVAELLTNPFYAGRLRTGEPSALGPLVDPATWEAVQAQRSRYARRHRGSVRRRQYVLSGLLVCAGCERRLIGHSGRYRHVDACRAFVERRPVRRRRFSNAQDRRIGGQSYPTGWYDEEIGHALELVAANAALRVDVVGHATIPEVRAGDELALARVERAREEAARRFGRARGRGAVEAARAPRHADAPRAATAQVRPPRAEEAATYLASLPLLWAETDDDGRRAIAAATFEEIRVLGPSDFWFGLTPTAQAHGWDAAFGEGPLRCPKGHSGRGERGCASSSYRSSTGAGLTMPQSARVPRPRASG